MDFRLITGAASGNGFLELKYSVTHVRLVGIGRETAIIYAKEECERITIPDRNIDGLRETRRIIESHSQDATVRIAECDLLDEDSVQRKW